MKRNWGVWMMASCLLAGCAAAPVVVVKKEVTPPAVAEPVGEAPALPEAPAAPAAVPRVLEDRELLLDGVRLLSLDDRPERERARSIFASLVARYPQSRWRPVAEALIHLIDEGETSRETNRQNQLLLERAAMEKTRVLQENEALKKSVRDLTAKLQTETSALVQENEQLKQDIQRLKALEIELEKRERRLR
jgi:hypothetical protein